MPVTKAKKQKNNGIAIVAMGAVLLLAALALFLYNQNEDANAGQDAEALLVDIQQTITAQQQITPQPQNSPVQPDEEQVEPEPSPFDPTLREVEIQGYNCVGFLTISAIEIEVPVISQWDYERLKSAPCRQYGSSKTDDLVIAAHNYDRHFGKLKNLVEGDAVIFTDMDGNVNTYAAKRTEIVDPEDVDKVYYSGNDLVLYTCTKGGKNRVVVFCDRNMIPD